MLLSPIEREIAIGLLEVEAATWRRLKKARHTTDAENIVFERNASILERLANEQREIIHADA